MAENDEDENEDGTKQQQHNGPGDSGVVGQQKQRKSPFSRPASLSADRRRPSAQFANSSAMAPSPYDDGLFIEPAGDYDVVFGDYNSTMADGTPSAKRPYIRLTVPLNNVTRPAGSEVRMRCEAAASPLPIQFTWLKNLAPVEKNRRIRIRHREMSSKLAIIELDVLDSGYYQCTATNAAGSVNSTAVLKVSTSLQASSSSISSLSGKKRGGRVQHQHQHKHQNHHNRQPQQPQQAESSDAADYDNTAYDNYVDEEEMKSTNEEFRDHQSGPSDHRHDLWRVPNSAGGSGFVPLRRAGESDGRWLDGKVVRKGDCIAYRGEACQHFLAGRHVKVLVDREQIYDAEKDLLAALMTVRVMPGVSEQCRQYSHQVACYHMFKVCEPALSSVSALSSIDTLSLCREDCDQLRNNICPNEFAMAAQHDLVGDAPKALLPNCDALADGVPKCLHVMDQRSAQPPSGGDPFGPTSSSSPSSPSDRSHWCFVGAGTKYQGIASTTRSDRPCIYWPSTPNSEFNTGSHPQLRSAKNHCRNPSRRSQFQEPWCYTVSPGNSLVAEPCNVPRCPPNLHAELDDSASPFDSSLASLTAFWDSLSSHSQLLTLSTGLGAIVFLLLLLLCLFCCRREKGRRMGRRRKIPRGPMAQQQQQQESASSMLSGSVVAASQQKVSVAGGPLQNGHLAQMPQHHHHHVLAQSCNGGSTITNSDLNSAFYRKVQDERLRAAGVLSNDELLNPLLPYGGGAGDTLDRRLPSAPFVGTAHPQSMFELKQSQQQLHHTQQPYRFWESGAAPLADTMHSACGAGGGCYPPYYIQQSQKQQQQQPYGSLQANAEPTPAEPYQIASIRPEQLRFSDQTIGEDSSTFLTLGEWEGAMISGATLKVAIKSLKPNVPHIAVEQFQEEIKAVGMFEHHNVVRLLGVSFLQAREMCAVFDYMVHGDLVEFLKVREPRGGTENDEQERARNAEDFLRIATQITAGMQYLASKSFVHRDLAARNCLVGDQQVIKVSDFARMKPKYTRDYYKLNANARGVPLRWLSREVLNEGKYSEASDVFAFGVCLWEIYTYARQPYECYTDDAVIGLIQEETLLEMPEYCPPAVYAQMVECFNANAQRRPSFSELYSKFQKWLTSGQPSALQMQQHRASSVHSGGSGSAVNGHLMNGQTGRMLRQTHPPGASVPSPAPNGPSTILAGAANGGKPAQMAKLALLSNGGASIVHSTPIAQNLSDDGAQTKRPIPRRRQPPAHNRAAYTEDEDDDEAVSYSSDGSRDS